jgi:hypothetical protein
MSVPSRGISRTGNDFRPRRERLPVSRRTFPVVGVTGPKTDRSRPARMIRDQAVRSSHQFRHCEPPGRANAPDDKPEAGPVGFSQ